MGSRAPRLKDFPLSGPRVERLFRAGVGATWGGQYVHWDDIQDRKPPSGLPLHEWWLGMKLVRRAASRSGVVLIPDALRRLHNLDRFRLPEVPRRIAVDARLDEAVSSALLAGAEVSRENAKQLLRSGRKPRGAAEELVHDTWTRLEAPPPVLSDERRWQHPIVAAILDHMNAEDRRLGRIAFYGALRAAGYEPLRLASISTILRAERETYDRSFQLVASDDGDATYFVLHQLDVLERAAVEIRSAVERTAQQLERVADLAGDFNERQRALLNHALAHPSASYSIATHRSIHGIVYETARSDLRELEGKCLLRREKIGRAFWYLPEPNLSGRLAEG